MATFNMKSRPRRFGEAPLEGTSSRQAAAYIVAMVGPILVAALVTPVLTRLFGANAYGQVAMGLSVAQVGQIPLALGLAAALNRHVRLVDSGAAGALGIAIAGGGVAVALALVTAVVSVPWGSIPTSMQVGLASAAALSIFGMLQSIMVGLGRAWAFAVQAAVLSSVAALCGLLAVTGLGRSPVYYLGALAVTQFGLVALFYARAAWRHGVTLRTVEYASAVRLGIPTVPHQLASMAVPAVSVMCAGAIFKDAGAAGQLQLIFLITSLPAMAMGAINNVWAVNAYSTPDDARAEYLSRTLRVMAKLGLLAALATNLASPWAVSYLASGDMNEHEMMTAAAFATASVVFTVMYFANIHQVFATGRTALLAVTTPTASLTALGCAALLTQMFPSEKMLPFVFGVLTFNVLQVLTSAWLRRRAGIAQLRIVVPWAIASAGAAQAVLLAYLPLSEWARGLLVGLCAVLLIRELRRLSL